MVTHYWKCNEGNWAEVKSDMGRKSGGQEGSLWGGRILGEIWRKRSKEIDEELKNVPSRRKSIFKNLKAGLGIPEMKAGQCGWDGCWPSHPDWGPWSGPARTPSSWLGPGTTKAGAAISGRLSTQPTALEEPGKTTPTVSLQYQRLCSSPLASNCSRFCFPFWLYKIYPFSTSSSRTETLLNWAPYWALKLFHSVLIL